MRTQLGWLLALCLSAPVAAMGQEQKSDLPRSIANDSATNTHLKGATRVSRSDFVRAIRRAQEE